MVAGSRNETKVQSGRLESSSGETGGVRHGHYAQDIDVIDRFGGGSRYGGRTRCRGGCELCEPSRAVAARNDNRECRFLCRGRYNHGHDNRSRGTLPSGGQADAQQ